VYGGGGVGLMGAVADAALRAGGQVIGVIPQALVDKEVANHRLSDLRVVGSMHERKALMADLSDGFLVLPGGIGTMDEFFEVWTWGQLGLHAKPCGILNVGGFFDPLLAFLDRLVEQRFVRPEYRAMLLVSGDANGLLTDMAIQRPAYAPKWIDRASS
jgi:uncharacterized protein (TIGR00730 family)